MRKHIYKWHRRLSILIAIPVLLWASSGFMHPLMTNIRPAIATQGILSVPIDSHRIIVPLPTALRQHHLDSIAGFRLIHIDTNWFYQVQLPAPHTNSSQVAGSPSPSALTSPTVLTAPAANPALHPNVPIYLSCTNGNALPAGDWLYAQYLARQFLEGPPPSHHAPAGNIHLARFTPDTEPADCCGAATTCILHPSKGAPVANVSLVTSFDHEYNAINRLLPVYRVNFDRPDGIRIYVETTRDRFSFAMDNRRAIFDEIFRLFHTWGWLDFLGKGRLAVEMTFALLVFCTSLLGIYIFFSTRSKPAPARSTSSAPVKANPVITARRRHRYTAIVAALFTLLWSFSGSWHAFSKFTDDTRDQYSMNDHFATRDLDFSFPRLQAAIQHPITNISLAKIDGQSYWQVYTLPPQTTTPNGALHPEHHDPQPEHHDPHPEDHDPQPEHHDLPHKDLMLDKKVTLPPVSYIRTSDYTLLPDGDAKYARWMATRFSGQPGSNILSTTPITAFSDEYNFTDKRLPVWKVSYATNHNERFYVETSSGRLSVRVDDHDLPEGYSFSVFHKHHFMDWGGKTVRDVSTMFWAFAQVILVTIGLMLFFRRRNRARSSGQ